MTIQSLKNLWRFAVVPGLLALGCYAAYYGYVSTRQARLVSQAQGYLANSNTRTALLCLRRALDYNPRHIDTCRAMAEVSEKIGSAAAVLWRSRVVELSPKSTADRLCLAETALTFRDYFAATNALDGISQADRKTAAYHQAAGSVSLACRQPAEAEQHFVEASRLDPTNQVPRLNLAIVRLQTADGPALDQARTALQLLATNATLRGQALRELVLDAVRHQQTNTALTLSKELLAQTNSPFSDRLLRLDVFRATKNVEFEPALAEVEGEAAKDSRKVYELALWQASRNGLNRALAWLKSLPAETQTNQPAALLVAQFQVALRDWSGLQASIEEQDWAELDFVRHAFRSRALRGQELTSSALIEWTKALKAANGRKEDLVMLLKLVAQWNWLGEVEDLLWRIVSRYPSENWARVGLSHVLLADGRTRSLMTLYSQQVKANPSDFSARNNLAMLALLLNAQELRPHDLARQVYQKGPANPAYASTYAFSLYLQDRKAEALKVFDKLKPAQLEDPAVAVYYAVVLQATGNHGRARKYLDLATKARLLPEERKLVAQAKAGA
jgi:thioredoxin-like negative regulator of GroEL